MAVVPSIGRADRAVGAAAPEADLTRALYERYANQIFRYCLHQLGSREEAEDAVQSTFLNAFRGIKRGVVPELESAWLFKIAENVCLSRRRSAWRRDRIESPADFEVVEDITPAPGRLADELIGLQDVLEQMPENQRRAILLREWQGFSYREIGDELGLSQAAVETLIFRARRSLAQGLEKPPEPARKRRALRGGDWGNLLAGLKSMLLGGGAAAKVAAAVAVVSAGTIVAAAPVQQHRARPHAPAPASPAVTPGSTRQPALSPVVPAASHAPLAPVAPAVPAARVVPVPDPAAPPAPVETAAPAEAPAAPATFDAAVVPAPSGGGSPGHAKAPPPVDGGSPVAPPADPPASTPPGQGQGQGPGQGQGQGQGSTGPPSQPGNGNGVGQGTKPDPPAGGQGGGQGQGNQPDSPASGGQGQGQGQGNQPDPPAGSSGGGNGGGGSGAGQGNGSGHGGDAGHGH